MTECTTSVSGKIIRIFSVLTPDTAFNDDIELKTREIINSMMTRALDETAKDKINQELDIIGKSSSLILPRYLRGVIGNPIASQHNNANDSAKQVMNYVDPTDNLGVKTSIESIGKLIDNYIGTYVHMTPDLFHVTFKFLSPIECNPDVMVSSTLTIHGKYGRSLSATHSVKTMDRLHHTSTDIVDQISINKINRSQRPRTAKQLVDILLKILNAYVRDMHDGNIIAFPVVIGIMRRFEHLLRRARCRILPSGNGI